VAEEISAKALPLGDARWEALTEGEDVYFRPAWAETALGFDQGEPLLLHVESEAGQVILPVIERAIPGAPASEAPLVDWISPYGYSGPRVLRGRAGSWLRGLEAIARERRAVTAFLRCHPLERTQGALPDWTLPEAFRRRTAAVDLRREEGAIWRSLKPSHRRAVRKADASALEVRWGSAEADFAAFADLYATTMDRVDADPYYRLPDEYFPFLRDRLSGACGVLSAWLGGEPVAALLLLWGPRLLHYHLGGSRQEFLPLRPNNRLFWEAIRLGRERGLEWFHLGGGAGSDDDLLAFKMGFGSTALEWYKACLVLDPAAQEQLLAGRLAPAASGFFPPYRAAGRERSDR
jgi:hypothetical protein